MQNDHPTNAFPPAPSWYLGDAPDLGTESATGRPTADHYRQFMPDSAQLGVNLSQYNTLGDDGRWQQNGTEVFIDAGSRGVSLDDAEQLAHGILRAVAAARG